MGGVANQCSTFKSLVFPETLRHLAAHELSAIRFYIEDVLPKHFQFMDTRTMRALSTQLLELAGISKILLSAIVSHGMYSKASELQRFDPGTTSMWLGSSADSHEASVLEYLYASLRDCSRRELSPIDSHDEFRALEITLCIVLEVLSMVSNYASMLFGPNTDQMGARLPEKTMLGPGSFNLLYQSLQ
jgi:hypothetical protein